MKPITYNEIKTAYKALGYPFYEEDFNLNFGAIRTDLTGGLDQTKDEFNDIFFVAYKENGKPKVHQYEGTIDPGKLALLDPKFEAAKKDGTAIIAEGYHKSCYQLGFHGTGNWRHRALVQVGIMGYYRDNNRDVIINRVGKRHGHYATNHHCASLINVNLHIKRYSEGCAVAKVCSDLQKTCDLVVLQEKAGFGNKLSLSVTLESVFNKVKA